MYVSQQRKVRDDTVDRVQCDSGAWIPTGGVMEGSLRPQDLFTAALKVYEAVNPGGFVVMAYDYQVLLKKFVAAKGDEINYDIQCEFTAWEWAEILTLTADLMDWINAELPDGWYYGGHPDDPAYFGIWET